MRDVNEKEVGFLMDLDLGIDLRHLSSENFPNGWTSHWHDAIEMICVKTGSITVRINNSTDYIDVNSNQLVVIPPKALHEIKNTKNNFYIISIFLDLPSLTNQTFFSKSVISDILDEKITLPLLIDAPEIMEIVNNLATSYKKHTPIYIQGIACQLLGLLIEKSDSTQFTIKANRSKEFIDYIQERLSEDLKINDICEKFGYTESYFCRLFKSLTNVNFSTYLQIARIEEAKRLLQETEFTIKSISEKVGFSDFSYFCKCFKHYLNMTPLQYRNRFKNQIN